MNEYYKYTEFDIMFPNLSPCGEKSKTDKRRYNLKYKNLPKWSGGPYTLCFLYFIFFRQWGIVLRLSIYALRWRSFVQ